MICMTQPSTSDFLWFAQLSRDGEFIGTAAKPPRKPTLEYISSLIETAAEAGFSSLLTATNYHSEHENYTAAIAALARTRGAGLLIAVRPGMFHPAMYAKMLATAPTAADAQKLKDLAAKRPTAADLAAFLKDGGLNQR